MVFELDLGVLLADISKPYRQLNLFCQLLFQTQCRLLDVGCTYTLVKDKQREGGMHIYLADKAGTQVIVRVVVWVLRRMATALTGLAATLCKKIKGILDSERRCTMHIKRVFLLVVEHYRHSTTNKLTYQKFQMTQRIRE